MPPGRCFTTMSESIVDWRTAEDMPYLFSQEPSLQFADYSAGVGIVGVRRDQWYPVVGVGADGVYLAGQRFWIAIAFSLFLLAGWVLCVKLIRAVAVYVFRWFRG
jgi:hypothetical protein